MPINRPKLEDDYRELELKPGATLEEVRSSYRELALFWHPDRRNDGPTRNTNAHQKMTRINLAYERLRKALSGNAPPKPSERRRSHEDTSPTKKDRTRQAEQQ